LLCKERSSLGGDSSGNLESKIGLLKAEKLVKKIIVSINAVKGLDLKRQDSVICCDNTEETVVSGFFEE